MGEKKKGDAIPIFHSPISCSFSPILGVEDPQFLVQKSAHRTHQQKNGNFCHSPTLTTTAHSADARHCDCLVHYVRARSTVTTATVPSPSRPAADWVPTAIHNRRLPTNLKGHQSAERLEHVPPASTVAHPNPLVRSSYSTAASSPATASAHGCARRGPTLAHGYNHVSDPPPRPPNPHFPLLATAEGCFCESSPTNHQNGERNLGTRQIRFGVQQRKYNRYVSRVRAEPAASHCAWQCTLRGTPQRVKTQLASSNCDLPSAP